MKHFHTIILSCAFIYVPIMSSSQAPSHWVDIYVANPVYYPVSDPIPLSYREEDRSFRLGLQIGRAPEPASWSYALKFEYNAMKYKALMSLYSEDDLNINVERNTFLGAVNFSQCLYSRDRFSLYTGIEVFAEYIDELFFNISKREVDFNTGEIYQFTSKIIEPGGWSYGITLPARARFRLFDSLFFIAQFSPTIKRVDYGGTAVRTDSNMSNNGEEEITEYEDHTRLNFGYHTNVNIGLSYGIQ